MAKNELLENLGISPEWKLFGTGPAMLKAFEGHGIDLAYMGLPPAIIGIDRGLPIKCIAGGHIEGTVISGRSGLKGFPEADLADIFHQLRGMIIGVPGRGSIHDVILKDCLDRFALQEEISVINYAWADQATEAFVKKEVSAVIGTPALSVAVQRYSDGRMLYPPSRLWPHNPSYGILIDSTFLAQEQQAAELFLLGHEEATAFLMNRTDEAAQIISDYLGFIDKDFVFEVLMVSPKYCSMLTDEYVSSSLEFVDAMRRLGYINRRIASEEIFDRTLIKKIHPSQAHYEN